MSYQPDDLEKIDSVDVLGYIASSNPNLDEAKERIRNLFSENSIRIQSTLLDKLVEILEEAVDDNNHNSIKNFLSYLKDKYNLSFIREHTDEILIFDQNISDINSYE